MTALHHALIWFPVATVVAVWMDVWAGLLHGGVWHSWLWRVHRSHHTPRTGRFESNDALALFHAPPAIALILYGCVGHEGVLREVLFGIGIGMTAFAVGYLIVHDGLVHGRLPVQGLMEVPFFRRIARAHRVHHTLDHARPYSLFFGPAELRRASAIKRRRRSSGTGAPRSSTDRDARGRALS